MESKEIEELFSNTEFKFVKEDDQRQLHCLCSHKHDNLFTPGHFKLMKFRNKLKCITCGCTNQFASRVRKMIEDFIKLPLNLTKDKKEKETFTFINKLGVCLMIYDNYCIKTSEKNCECFVEKINERRIVYIKVYQTLKIDQLVGEVKAQIILFREFFPTQISPSIQIEKQKFMRAPLPDRNCKFEDFST